MQLKYLRKWVSSPIAGRRRKALKQLTKRALHGEADLREVYEQAKKATSDADWSVRSVALKAVAELALRELSLAEEALNLLLEAASRDEDPNVRMTAIDGLARIIRERPELMEGVRKKIFSLIDKALEDNRSNIREAALRLLLSCYKKGDEEALKRLEKVLDIAEGDGAPNVVSQALELLREAVAELKEGYGDRIAGLIAAKRSSHSPDVREKAALLLAEALDKGAVSPDESVIKLAQKYLRDEKIVVRRATLQAVRVLGEREPRLMDYFLGIIVWETLLRTRNTGIKLAILKLLEELLPKVPSEIVNKHEVPRALDILEKNTVPKNAELLEIKMLARKILEEDLGYTFEIRRKKWGGVRFREK